MSKLLELLGLSPSVESVDYVANKTQFQLHDLLTEQRHPRTWNLSFAVAANTEKGLRSILAVDADIERKLGELASDATPLEQMADAIATAVRSGRRIYVYGCGATGRLAKQMESSFWRPFWRRLMAGDAWHRVAPHLPSDVDDVLVGEMTGGDRALVSSLEGFEDLPLVGELQLSDHGIQRGDVVVCVTEGGETSSVIGAVLAARRQYEDEESDASRQNLYFVYNNPDDVLRPYKRSRQVLDEPGITKLNLATGPQAITGSTRMQATTIETFVIGTVLECAIRQLLDGHLDARELADLGFSGDHDIARRLLVFTQLRAAVGRAVPALAWLTELEAATYQRGAFATYVARRAMVTVFTDCTERSPTFRLYPLDPVDSAARRCWVQVWTDASDGTEAWREFLGRPFRGLDPAFYGTPLSEQVDDAYLRRAALDSLARAGSDQEGAYDFSLSEHSLARRGPADGDLGVMVLVGDEVDELERTGSAENQFRAACRERNARLVVVHTGGSGRNVDGDLVVGLDVAVASDPLGVRQHVALKILLNAHSTAAMARLGRVVGNTMTNVSPSNLKLIGRATFLVKSHVDDVVRQPEWSERYGPTDPLSYADANAVLFDAIRWIGERPAGQTAEVPLSIVRILESLRAGAGRSWEHANEIVERGGLAEYLRRNNPALDPEARE